MNPRSVFFSILLLLLLLFANDAFAGQPRYERTKDGKTLVWNNNPQPGDTATWSGERDKDGYATGKGTLTWSVKEESAGNARKIATVRYIGKSVRGKFEGRVFYVNADGKKFQGDFIDGRRTEAWSASRTGDPSRTGDASSIVSDASSPKDESARSADRTAETKPTDTSAEKATVAEQKPEEPLRQVEPVAAPAEGPAVTLQQTPAAEAPKPATPEPPIITPNSGTAVTEPLKKDVNDSLRALVGPQPLAAPASKPAAQPTPSPTATRLPPRH